MFSSGLRSTDVSYGSLQEPCTYGRWTTSYMTLYTYTLGILVV